MADSGLCDELGRRITTLRISVTDRCNLRCRYCEPESGMPLGPRAALLRFEEIAEVAAAAAALGIRRIKFTGGEPLLRRDIHRLVAMVAAEKRVEDLSLTTNGTLLAPLAEPLRRAGLNRVTVSLDTLRPERYRYLTRSDGPDAPGLQAALEGLAAACRAGLAPLKVNVVALRGLNDDEFADFARLTLEQPIEVRFIELMRIGGVPRVACKACLAPTPVDRQPVPHAVVGPHRFISAAEVRERVEVLGPLEPVDTAPLDGPAERFRFAGAPGTVGFIAPVSRPFCSRCNRLRLTSLGVLRACLLAGGEVPLKPVLRPRVDAEGLRTAFRAAARLKPVEHAGCGTTPMRQLGG